MTTPDTLRQLQDDYEAEKAKTAHMGLVIPGPASDAIAAAAPTHLAGLITALEREAKVRGIHTEAVGAGGGRYCEHDFDDYPCPTIRILDGNE